MVEFVNLRTPETNRGDEKMKAPEGIPGEMYEEYTMGGEIVMEYNYANDCSDETQEVINNGFTQEVFSKYLEMSKARQQNYYGPTDTWLHESLDKYPTDGKDICIMGSTSPWYEALLIARGAKSCTVIEYSKRKSFHENIEYVQLHEVKGRKFDACFSISSYEHDGLGRYGDPLNPNGDLEAMENTKNLLHDGALLYLAVPIGIDKLVFNVHRVYGEKRINLLLKGWDTLDQYGFFEDSFINNVNGMNGTPYQPIYVLRAQ